MTSDRPARATAQPKKPARRQTTPSLAAADAPIGRSEALSLMAKTGYNLEDHPAHIIRRAHQRATLRFQQVMSDDDLTPTQHATLATLLKHGELSQNHLGRLTAMDPSTISLIVRKLFKKKLIARHASETDQRLSMISLTEAGVRYTLERLKPSMEVAGRLLAPLSPDERTILLDLLRRISADEDG